MKTLRQILSEVTKRTTF